MARVDFQRGEFGELFRNTRATAPQIQDLFEQLQGASRNGVEIQEIMRYADELAETHGVEAIEHPGGEGSSARRSSTGRGFWGTGIAEYLNTGGTYDLTLLYDVENHAFVLTSYGDWLQEWEREHVEDEDGDVGPILLGPKFTVHVFTISSQSWPATAQWSLNEGMDPATEAHLTVEVPELKPVYTTAEMLRHPTFGTRLYTIGTFHTSMHLTKASVERAMIALDGFLELNA